MRQQEMSKLRADVGLLVEHDAAREAARNAGPSISEQIQGLLSDPVAVAREQALDVQLLGSDSPGRIDFRGMDSEEIAATLESALSASTP